MPGHYRKAKKHTEKGKKHDKKEKSYSDHCGSGTMKLNRMNRGEMKKPSVYMKKYTN
jgi:hypothetical protein|tara:strand:+ start:232 stop:402 length:171 start_codon:yes stop_codon:yes gene_type:complete